LLGSGEKRGAHFGAKIGPPGALVGAKTATYFSFLFLFAAFGAASTLSPFSFAADVLFPFSLLLPAPCFYQYELNIQINCSQSPMENQSNADSNK
jgi:hypothetical protein